MLSFDELPLNSQKALKEYAYMECETIEEARNYFANNTFTLEIISIEEAKRRCMEFTEDLWECETFEEYHEMYLKGGDTPYHGNSIYPVIQGFEDEWLLDGWHRFHSYVKYNKKEIPVLSIH